MAGRRKTQPLSSFSWKREGELSAARKRLSGRAGTSPTRSVGHLSLRRIVWYSVIVAILLAALSIAFMVQRPEVMRFFQRPGTTGSART